MITAKDSGGEFEKTPTGMHQAVCAFVFDIGTHISTFAGQTIKAHKIIVTWELSETMKEGDNAGKRFTVSKYYTLSLGEKANLRKDLESWRGKSFTDDELRVGFDVEKLIGVNCLLNIGQNENGKAKILSINPLQKGVVAIKPEKNVTQKFYDWIEKERAKSVEKATDDTPYEDAPPPDNDRLPF